MYDNEISRLAGMGINLDETQKAALLNQSRKTFYGTARYNQMIESGELKNVAMIF